MNMDLEVMIELTYKYRKFINKVIIIHTPFM